MKKAFTVIAILLGFIGLMSLSSCNTVSGFGEDLQSLGKKMERKADRSPKDY